MSSIPDEPKQGPPAYMVSFGDMMTLVLTFFILLVSLSKEQQAGLLARGVGSFIVAIQSHGLNGILSASERQSVFEHTRRRFNLPPEEDPERREEHVDASSLELLKARAAAGLTPHDEVNYPYVAVFAVASESLTDDARRYLDRLAPSLMPQRGQVLLLEGHAGPHEGLFGAEPAATAFRRARAVERYLVERHDFRPDRIQARAWSAELHTEGIETRSVDARLVTPRSHAPR